MKLSFRKQQRTPYVPEGVQVFHGEQPSAPKPKRRIAVWVVLAIVIIVITIIAGLALGRFLSTNDDNDDAAQRASSEQRVNQSPQDGQPGVSPTPTPVLNDTITE